MTKLLRFFLPTIVGITVYIVVSRLFPKRVLGTSYEKDLRGGNIVRNHLIKKIVKKIMYDRALKIALISVFITAGFQHFNEEIETLLVDEIFNQMRVEEANGQLKIVCDIVKEHELNLHSNPIRELVVANSLSRENKVNLLKIKLDFIINGECSGKGRFLIVSSIATIMTICVSGVSGLAIFLEALYRLFKEGKISLALYEDILKIMAKKWTKVPVEHLL
jgi:hypothetical protein